VDHGTGDGSRPTWPGGAPFAFTIVDDTDKTTLENGPLVYDLLTSLGIRATKTVWPVAPDGPGRTGGSTCEEPDYLAWVLELQEAGHEIGFHNATDETSERERTIAALDRFAELFGHDPRVGADHSANAEALYWGPKRLTGMRGAAYRTVGPLLWDHDLRSEGDDPTSPHFWGDVCRERIDYWRNFTFASSDVLDTCPALPYHDPDRPLVRWWYAATHAPHLDPFVAAVGPERLDALERRGGACILYTHFGTNFVWEGELQSELEPALRAVVDRGAWCAPVSAVLDHLRAERGDRVISHRERARLERRWMIDQVGIRTRALADQVRARWS
jgi:hypothetical protein